MEYYVTWSIDIEADSAEGAALSAAAILRDPANTASIFHVCRGQTETVIDTEGGKVSIIKDARTPEQIREENYNEDCELSATQLDDKYNPDGGGEHPDYTFEAWAAAVGKRGTWLGYWEWVECQLHLSTLP